MSEAAEIYRLVALAWLLSVFAVALLIGLCVLMWQEMRAECSKHPFDDDIPHWWQ